MKNEQSYVLAVTYSSSKATEEIAGRTERTVGKTSEDVQRLTQTVESLSAAAKGISRVVKASWCTTAADNVLLQRTRTKKLKRKTTRHCSTFLKIRRQQRMWRSSSPPTAGVYSREAELGCRKSRFSIPGLARERPFYGFLEDLEQESLTFLPGPSCGLSNCTTNALIMGMESR